MTKALTIKVTNEKIFLTDDLSIGIYHTNLFGKEIYFRKEVLFWETEVVKIIDGILFLKVVDFDSKHKNLDTTQPSSEYAIAKIEFEKFEKEKFEPVLSSYKKKDLSILCGIEVGGRPSENSRSELARNKFREAQFSKNSKMQTGIGFSQFDSNYKTKIIKRKFVVSFEEFEIIDGGVRFKKSIPEEVQEQVEFFIGNPLLLKEFNLIKGWFKKKLKIEGITVFAEIKLHTNEITVLKAESKEVELINNELIEAIQIERVTNLASKSAPTNQDDFLFSLDELFQEADLEDFGGNLFDQSENDILDILLKNDGIRNAKHLRYLADKVQSVQFKIQFTFEPRFGFLFTRIGKNKMYYVLELLNSNATYIWRFPTLDAEKNHFRFVNKELKKLHELKRRNYRNQADESIFQAVDHKGVGRGQVVDIGSWEKGLNDALD